MSTTTRPDLLSGSTLFKMLAVWIPIVGGVVHQLMMFFLNSPPQEPYRGDGIWVFVNPPGYVYPFVSLEYTWWFVLLIGSAAMCITAYSDRVESIPTRVWVPFYIYILFLLILVKPV